MREEIQLRRRHGAPGTYLREYYKLSKGQLKRILRRKT
jgi:hypothetical protein